MIARGFDTIPFQPAIEVGAELAHEQVRGTEAVMGAETGCMPGRTRRQFGFLEQHDITPALFHQLHQQPATIYTAANDGHAHVHRHALILSPPGS